MAENNWYKIVNTFTPEVPVDLDDVILRDRATRQFGKVLFPDMDLLPSTALWEREVEDHTYIGVRIVEPSKSPYTVARLLAAAAIERNVVPIILSRVDYCGLEQFGFRIERIPDEETAARTAEEEVGKFWNFAIVIDGHDVARLS